jgi:hypothetical protein
LSQQQDESRGGFDQLRLAIRVGSLRAGAGISFIHLDERLSQKVPLGRAEFWPPLRSQTSVTFRPPLKECRAIAVVVQV